MRRSVNRPIANQGPADCGPVALAFVARYWSIEASVANLRMAAGTNAGGTTILGVVHAAKKIGFDATGLKVSLNSEISKLPLPAILLGNSINGLPHFVVLRACKKGQWFVFDPECSGSSWWPGDKIAHFSSGHAVILAPGMTFPRRTTKQNDSVRRLFDLLRPQKNLFIQAFVGAALATILALGMAFNVEQLIDRVIPNGDHRLLALLGCGMVVLLVVRAGLGVFQSLLVLRTAQEIDAVLVMGYYRHLLRLPQAFFDSMRIGEIVARVGDAVKVRQFLSVTLIGLLLNPLLIVCSIGAMFFYSSKLAVLAVGLLPLFGAVQWLTNLLNRRYQRELMERGADFESQLVESLHSQRVVRSFGTENDSGLKMENRLVRLLRTGWSASMAGLGTSTAGMMLTHGFVLALLWVGAGLALQGVITPGELMSCYTLAGYLTGPMLALLGLNASVQDALIATDRLYEVMDLERERDSGTVEFTADHAAQAIRLERVTFRHAGRLPVLHDVSCVIPGGKITALAGESGSGKSTILSLLQRLYLPEQGKVYLGELDIAHYTLASLRQGIAVVPQKVDLTAGSILENLAPGEYPPDVERLVRLCRETGFMEFIDQQPQGFATHLGENGLNLSGGQRQKLAIVRALYRNAGILLLDEPSSALDAKAEEALVALLARLRAEGRTVVIAAHNPRLLAVADVVVTLASGRVVEPEPRVA